MSNLKIAHAHEMAENYGTKLYIGDTFKAFRANQFNVQSVMTLELLF